MDTQALERQVKETLATLGDATFYELLGTSNGASEADIRAAFREKARIFHVDRYSDAELGELREPMQRIFGEISKAHATLTERTARQEYDASLELAEKGVPTDVRTIFMADQAFRAGKRLVERSSFVNGLEKLELACELNPTEPDYWSYRSWAEFGILPTDEDGKPTSQVKVREVKSRLETIVREHEHCVSARVFLGHINRADGNVEEAQRNYKSALRLDSNNLEAQSSLRLLNRRKEKKTGLFERIFGKK